MPGSTKAPSATPASPPPEGPAAAAERLLRLDMPIYGAPEEAVAQRVQVPSLFSRSVEPAEPPAAADGRTRQGSLLVMPVIRPGQFERLRELLETIGDAPSGEELVSNRVIPFRELKTVHFLRILVHPASPSKESPIPEWDGVLQASGEPIPPKLLFSTDFDGPLDEHVDELLDVAGHGLDVIFGHCVGWPGHQDRRGAHDFFLRFRVPTNTFYTGTMGRTVHQIRREAHLRERIQGFLDENAGKPDLATDAVRIRERVREWVFAQPDLQWTKVKPGPYPRLLLPQFFIDRLGLTAGILLLAVAAAAVGALSLFLPPGTAVAAVLLPLVVLGAIGYAGYRYLCRLSATDPVIIGDVHQHTRRLVATEDRIVQNEMSSVIYIKRPLWFRGLVLRGVLAFIDFAARYLSNQGTLAGIPSIHFARWVVVDGGRRLVFFSNFDGSWENYLGDFIDKSHGGLTAVWSNCVGFPRTVGLTGKGATDEQRFKAYSRQSQVPTQVWYSAYRWLSVSNINDNTRLRLGLYGGMTQKEAEQWLAGASARKVEADKRRPAKPVAKPRVEVGDVQGLVARSYSPLRYAVYVPVTFDREGAAGARAWVGALAGRVTPASRSSAAVKAERVAVNVAFSRSGLRALGLDADAVDGFSREFEEGIATPHRKRVLGDRGDTDPDQWEWGGPKNPVDAMLLLFADGEARLNALRAEEEGHAAANGVALGTPLDSITLPDAKEHFGFHDGIAQPRIAGLKDDDGDSPSTLPTIPAGEVLLGYRNAYDVVPQSPTVPDEGAAAVLLPLAPADPTDADPAPRRDLGRNGTYMVFRQLEQDVKAFWRFADTRAEGDPERRKWLAAKMVGRWPNGTPLVREPDREPETFDAARGNDFWYRGDLSGDRCPLGSHIRRSNPRDGMMPDVNDSLLVADRHRLLRRGRAYGRPLAETLDPGQMLAADDPLEGRRGLHFICFNTDIARQFEFVQNTWINNMKFDGQYHGPDPVAAPHVDPEAHPEPEEVSNFVVQRCPVRHREKGVPRFVTVRGGAYLFMPGVRALQYLSRLG